MNYTERQELRAVLQMAGIPEDEIEMHAEALIEDAKETDQPIFPGRDHAQNDDNDDSARNPSRSGA